MSVFETDENFRPLDSKMPLSMERVPFDEHKIFSAIKIIGKIDSGEAKWIPNKYLSKDKNSKDVQDLEQKSAQMAFGKAIILLEKKDYEAALLNITASLLSEYLRKNPKYESRFLRKQAEGYVGLDNYAEAKKALLRARELCSGDSDFEDYFVLGSVEYKLGNKEGALDNLRKFIKLANIFLESSHDTERNKKIGETVEISNKLINKVG